MKFHTIVSDPPWLFSDKLTMSQTKRGASSQYKVMTDQDIINLDVSSITANDALLALWVPSSKLKIGMECMESWGFEQKQTWVWVKVKKEPLNEIRKELQRERKFLSGEDGKHTINQIIDYFDLNARINRKDEPGILDFGMGRLFRQTHELVLVGTKGNVYKHLKNKSQRSVYFWSVGEHSEKPEGLQDMLDVMFPRKKKLEMFARRVRSKWTCVGYECPATPKEDIVASINRLAAIKR